ncbi:hypothetical protein JCM19992_27440 [Thermostilla marina]
MNVARFLRIPRSTAHLAVTAWLLLPAVVFGQGVTGHIDHIFPAGGTRGTTLQVEVVGDDLAACDGVRVSGRGVTGKVVETKPPTKTSKAVAVVELTIDAEAPVGLRDLRLHSPAGFTNRAIFAVGDLPQVREVEPNSLFTQAQKIESTPITIDGQITQADIDVFRFAAKAGDTIVCRVEAQRLRPFLADGVPGWFQAVLTLFDSQGKQLAYVDDYYFHPDPVLIFEVPKDGEYAVELRDSIFRGRDDFVYRLTIGTIPFITSVFPRGLNPGQKATIQLAGVNLPSNTIEVVAPDLPRAPLTVSVDAGGIRSNELPLAVTAPPSTAENEPNDAAETAQAVPFPVSVDGRIDKPGDVDFFKIHVSGKQTLAIETAARRYESPLDSIVTVLDANGKQLAENDDVEDPYFQHITHHADSQLTVALPAEGDYLIRLADIQGKGGPEFSYRLVVAPAVGDFQLRVLPDVPRISQGSSAVLTVRALRKWGFNGEIAVSVDDLPPGFTAGGAVIGEGEDQTILSITAPADAPLKPFTPKIVGMAEIAGKPVVRTALPAEDVMQAFYYHHFLPTDEMLVSVLEPGPFKLIPEMPEGYIRFASGRTAFLKVKIEKEKTVTAPIRLMLQDPPKGVTMRLVTVPPNQDEAELEIRYANQLPANVIFNLVVVGTTKVGNETVSAITPAFMALGPSAKPPKGLVKDASN